MAIVGKAPWGKGLAPFLVLDLLLPVATLTVHEAGHGRIQPGKTSGKNISSGESYKLNSTHSGHMRGLVAADFSAIEILDSTATDPDLTGFLGGFAHGAYGYLAPFELSSGVYHGKVVRFPLNDFNSVDVLDLTLTGSDLYGYRDPFTDGTYGYLCPYRNHGKVVRFSLSDFSTVQVLDLGSIDGDMRYYTGGFTHGSYGYLSPYGKGKIPRFRLSDFSFVDVLDLEATDSDLQYFHGAFTDGYWGYLTPYRRGKMARFQLSDFHTVEILDLNPFEINMGYYGGFAHGMYGYLAPRFSGNVVRFSLTDFTTVDILDLTAADSDLQNFYGAFTDGTYGYLGPQSRGNNGKVPRFRLSDFSGVEVLELQATDSELGTFSGGFVSGSHAYLNPWSDRDGYAYGKVVKFQVAAPVQAQPTPAPAASATGDPHLQNIHGERFDLMRPGNTVLIQIPRGHTAEKALLTVEADARRLGSQCADIYFQSLNITGAWADKMRAGGLTFTAGGARDETLQIPGWTKFGPLKLKVVHGRTSQGIEYLNFYVKHLREAGAAVGGLLGEDDYTEAATPEEGCRKSMTLGKKAISNSDVGRTEAIASLA